MMIHWIAVISVALLYIAASKAEVERFQVIWNTPSEACIKKFDITIPLTDSGIKSNSDEAFNGDQIVVFYSNQLGLYPHVAGDTVVNGGIPQNVNIADHLAKMRSDIEKVIPNTEFNGIAVIDWEDWRPLWSADYDKKAIYKKLSLERTMKRFPGMSKKDAQSKAEIEFNTAARNLMMETIRFAKSLRPFAKWGYYGFPYCHSVSGTIEQGKCNDHTKLENNEYDINIAYCCCIAIGRSKKQNCSLAWLFNESIAVYPSIYLDRNQMGWPQGERHLYVQAILEETLRVTKDPARPFFPFTKFSYDPYSDEMPFYSEEDCCSTLKQVADLGGSGALVWSSSFSTSTAERCQQIADYIANEFGPTAKNVIQQAQKCASDQCSNQGSCVLDPRPSCTLASSFDQYSCSCDSGYQGSSCDESTGGSVPEPESSDVSVPEPESSGGSVPALESSDVIVPEPESTDDSLPASETSDGGAPEPVPESGDDSEPEPKNTDASLPAPGSGDDNAPVVSESNDAITDEFLF